MSNAMQELEAQWNAAVEAEDATQVEQLVRTILRQHPLSPLASEIRYKRGVLNLTEGEGLGSERLARAVHEFREGLKAGEAAGQAAEPWRSLNRTQLGVCLARRNNIDGALQELQAVASYRPHSTTGLGALMLITEILESNNREREAKRFHTQRLTYARALVRENEDADDIHALRFLLAQELLDSPYRNQGEALLQELAALDEETLGTELYTEMQEFIHQWNASS